MGFIEDHTSVMTLVTRVIGGMVEAMHALDVFDIIITDADGISPPAPAHQRWLSEWARRECQSEFLFVTGYPMAKRPFYTHPDPARPALSNSVDLLFRELEIVTGGQRLHRHEDYLQALTARGVGS